MMVKAASNFKSKWKTGECPVPGYKLEHLLGRGTVGEVWRATGPGNVVSALKFVDLQGYGGLNEWNSIQRIKQIRHANLLPITGIWLIDEDGLILDDETTQQDAIRDLSVDKTLQVNRRVHILVIAMPYAEKTLEERLHECEPGTGIPSNELCKYMQDVARAIDFLNNPIHDLGHGESALHHCDVKPANIVIVGSSAQLCDYGLVYMTNDETRAEAFGSPAFMSPEIQQFRKPSQWSDQYSLAITYVELRTGTLPFDRFSLDDVFKAHQKGGLNLSQLSEAEKLVIKRATSIEPNQRFVSAMEMVEQLERSFRSNDDNTKNGKSSEPRVDLAAVIEETERNHVSSVSATAELTSKQRFRQAAKWYRRAALQGAVEAQLQFGHCCYFGRGIERDFEQAVVWYRKAATKGDPVAQNNLGTCYCLGRGVTKDLQQAAKWMTLAAEQGYVRAQINLANLYSRPTSCQEKSTCASRRNKPMPNEVTEVIELEHVVDAQF